MFYLYLYLYMHLKILQFFLVALLPLIILILWVHDLQLPQKGFSQIIWRHLLRDIEIDRIQRSEELLKIWGGQKVFIFRGFLPQEGMEGGNPSGGCSRFCILWCVYLFFFQLQKREINDSGGRGRAVTV